MLKGCDKMYDLWGLFLGGTTRDSVKKEFDGKKAGILILYLPYLFLQSTYYFPISFKKEFGKNSIQKRLSCKPKNLHNNLFIFLYLLKLTSLCFLLKHFVGR
jgi:hypothetical protein